MKERNDYDTYLTNKDRVVVETLWLQYFNAVLLAKGVITEETHKRMQREILNRPGGRNKKI